MFNDKFLLTKAVLDGRKTQARLIVPQKELDKISLFQEEYYNATLDKLEGIELLVHYFFTEKRGKLPYDTGEVVAVAQSYKDVDAFYNAAFNRKHSVHGMIIDILDCVPDEDIKKWFKIRDEFKDKASWNNKMFVKPEYMPHQIRITDVCVERLQNISDECCLKEGIIKEWHAPACKNYYYVPGVEVKSVKDVHDTPQESFANLINKVSRRDVWTENPYVFVYDFELVK